MNNDSFSVKNTTTKCHFNKSRFKILPFNNLCVFTLHSSVANENELKLNLRCSRNNFGAKNPTDRWNNSKGWSSLHNDIAQQLNPPKTM